MIWHLSFTLSYILILQGMGILILVWVEKTFKFEKLKILFFFLFIIIIYIQKILSLYYLLHTIGGQFQGLILGLNLSEFSSLLTMGYSHARAHLVHSWGLNRATFWKNDAFSSTQSADHQHVFIKIWLDEQGCLQAPRCSQWCLFLLPELHSENRRISLGLR